jgi:hypothetical protein
MSNSTYAYYTVVGSGDHNRITETLGVEPSSAFTEGTPIPGRSGKYGATKWRIDSAINRDCPLHECLEEHVENVVSQVERIKDKLNLLSPDYEKYIQCVAYYEGCNLGLWLSSDLLKRIAALSIGLEFDLYSLPDE